MPARKEITTKSGLKISESWCRRCVDMRPASNFYEAVDLGFVDRSMLMSVCNTCIQDMYDEVYKKTNSIEQSIHKLCTSLNIMYSNDALSATKTHIQTIIDSGKNVNAVFGIYKQKLTATKKSMDKSGVDDMSYEDVGVIFTSKELNTEVQIPQSIIEFWGEDFSPADTKYLQSEYVEFTKTFSTENHTDVSLLKQICYTLLELKDARRAGDSTRDLTKGLQDIMKSLKIAPSAKDKTDGKIGEERFGEWIRDIELYEPAQWLKSDPRGDMYRDVGNVAEYFENYIVRAIKNFITGSKDFNINEEENTIESLDDEELFADVDDYPDGE